MAITLLVLFIIIALLNILYYIGYFSFATAKPSTPNGKKIPVSVIVCAKNEAENLKNFIPLILNQNYPDFEVILINDASTDDTLDIMEGFQENDPRIKIVDVQNNEAFWGKKKYALTLGIKKARNHYLLFTDADCAPESDLWIHNMSAHFQENKSIILGYGGYFKEKLSLLNKLIRYETLFTAIQYFSYARLGYPYMGVGRNLAYTSHEFYAQNGFATHLHVRSGDDDLFVNQAATKENTALCFESSSITRSIPNSSFKNWVDQKRRHISTATLYRTEHKFLLGTFFISQFLFWTLFIVLIISQTFWPAVMVIFTIRLLIQYVVFYKSAKRLDELDLVWLVPVFDFFLVFLQFGIFCSNIISKPANWK